MRVVLCRLVMRVLFRVVRWLVLFALRLVRMTVSRLFVLLLKVFL